MQPLVSVIVPVYNVEQYLDRCIQSIIAQTLNNIEIILVDDNSSDQSPNICDKYVSHYPQIRVIHKAKNEGLGMACNSGIEIARGEYIAFCDSDDYIDSNMYETMYKTAIKYNADAVYTGIKTVNQHGIVHPMNDYSSLQIIKEKNEIHKFIMDMIASQPMSSKERDNAMSAKIVLYKKDLITKYKLRFVSERILICEDLIWNIEVLCHSNCIISLPYTGYYYYHNTNSISKQIRLDRFSFFKSLREELYQRISYYGMPKETQIRIDRMFIGYCRFYIGNICKSSLPSQTKKRIVSEICKDSIWEKIWNTYPTKEMPKTHLLILYLMKYNCYTILSLIFKIRN